MGKNAPPPTPAPVPLAPRTRPGRSDILLAVLLAAGAAAAFGPALRAEFVGLDDPTYVVQNRHVLTGLTAENAAWAFTALRASNWHPLTWLSLQLDASLWGPGPFGFHLTNVLLHAANAALLFLALRSLTGAPLRSAVVAALFAVHPLRVESVAWIAERKDVLSAFFGLLALWAYAAYARAPAARRYVLVAGALLVSLLAKPMLVTFPCLLLVLDGWPLRRARVTRDWQRLAAEKLPLVALCLSSCAVTLVAQQQGGAVASLGQVPLAGRLANAAVAYATYLGLAAWPQGLAAYYPYAMTGWPAARVAVAVLALAALTALAVWQRRRRPYLLSGWLWYAGTLVPMIGLVQVGGQAYADRYTYFPMIGIAVAAVWAVAAAAGPARARAALVAAAGFVALLAALTWTQTAVWHDDLTLWPHTLAVTDANALAESNLGVALEKRGQADEAIRHYAEAVAILPNYGPAQFNLARLLDEQGRTAEAVRHYREAVRWDPRLAEAHNNLGAALGKQGLNAEAAKHYREALRVDPEFALAHRNLGTILEIRGRDAEALGHYREAVRLDPADAAARGRLGVALGKRGDLVGAVGHLRRTAELEPRSGSAQFNLGVALEKLGREGEAVECFRRAVELDARDVPNAVRDRLRLASALTRAGDTGGAAEQYREALRLDPAWPDELSREAWRCATGPDPRERDAGVAVWAAESACNAVRPPPAPYLDALAAAYAEAGRFADAVAAAERAVAAADAAGKRELAGAIAGRLALYRERQPFHRPPPPAPR